MPVNISAAHTIIRFFQPIVDIAFAKKVLVADAEM